jgi:hypothetical protein
MARKKEKVPYWDNGTTLYDFPKRRPPGPIILRKKKPEVRLILKKPEKASV